MVEYADLFTSGEIAAKKQAIEGRKKSTTWKGWGTAGTLFAGAAASILAPDLGVPALAKTLLIAGGIVSATVTTQNIKKLNEEEKSMQQQLEKRQRLEAQHPELAHELYQEQVEVPQLGAAQAISSGRTR